MEVQCYNAHDLPPTWIDAWAALQSDEPTLESPYFRPEFTQAVASARDDVEVAVMLEHGEPSGFFPFHRTRSQVALPVGMWMSDYHGVVARDDLSWDAEQLLRDCQLAAWDFDHLIAAQRPLEPYHHIATGSPYLDLSQGFEAYRQARQQAGSSSVSKALRKGRKLDREVGPLRLVEHAGEDEVFAQMIAWKRDQYARTKVPDVLAVDWPVALLRACCQHRDEAFCGMLSALYAGDRLAAVSLNLRSGGVLHSWFPAYDPELHAYSPGLVLMIEVARAAPSWGIRRFDLGKGEQRYKKSLMSAAVPLAEGSVACAPLAKMRRDLWRRVRGAVRSSPLRRPAQLAARSYYRLRARWQTAATSGGDR